MILLPWSASATIGFASYMLRLTWKNHLKPILNAIGMPHTWEGSMDCKNPEAV